MPGVRNTRAELDGQYFAASKPARLKGSLSTRRSTSWFLTSEMAYLALESDLAGFSVKFPFLPASETYFPVNAFPCKVPVQ